VSATTGGAFGIADVYKLDNALPARARGGNLSWIANRAVINLIRGFDTSGGSSFWANLGQSTSTAPQLLDAQIHEVSAMTSTVTTGSNLLILGNFSDYVIVDRIGTTIVYDENIKGANGRPTGQAGWLGYRRVGADVMNADSFRLLRL
jgi:HK97 family phage major capsid protein